MSVLPQYSMGRAGSGERKPRHGVEEKHLSPLVCGNRRWWEEFLATGGACGSHLSVSDPCCASQIEADPAAYAKLFRGGISLAHFQDFCEKPKGCWLEQTR